MKKIDIAKLLKDCPKGMELDCTMYENVTFAEVVENDSDEYPIVVSVGGMEDIIRLTKEGCWTSLSNAKCVIFPKGKTTWEGFQIPFKDGDILSYQCIGFRNRTVYIYRYHHTMNTSFYVALGGDLEFRVNRREGYALSGYNSTARLATEEEKQKLFQAIKERGYKWNAETKTLEKLIEPKFKVGDKVRHKNNHNVVFTITNIEEDSYIRGAKIAFGICDQDGYELVPNKFDINTLVPFESRVLVRDNKSQKWSPAIWGFYDSDYKDYQYRLVGVVARYCIPYEHNEHLLGTTDDCDEYFKTWM